MRIRILQIIPDPTGFRSRSDRIQIRIRHTAEEWTSWRPCINFILLARAYETEDAGPVEEVGCQVGEVGQPKSGEWLHHPHLCAHRHASQYSIPDTETHTRCNCVLIKDIWWMKNLSCMNKNLCGKIQKMSQKCLARMPRPRSSTVVIAMPVFEYLKIKYSEKEPQNEVRIILCCEIFSPLNKSIFERPNYIFIGRHPSLIRHYNNLTV